MQQVMDHKYVVMSYDLYKKGYDTWVVKEIPKLTVRAEK